MGVREADGAELEVGAGHHGLGRIGEEVIVAGGVVEIRRVDGPIAGIRLEELIAEDLMEEAGPHEVGVVGPGEQFLNADRVVGAEDLDRVALAAGLVAQVDGRVGHVDRLQQGAAAAEGGRGREEREHVFQDRAGEAGRVVAPSALETDARRAGGVHRKVVAFERARLGGRIQGSRLDRRRSVEHGGIAPQAAVEGDRDVRRGVETVLVVDAVNGEIVEGPPGELEVVGPVGAVDHGAVAGDHQRVGYQDVDARVVRYHLDEVLLAGVGGPVVEAIVARGYGCGACRRCGA